MENDKKKTTQFKVSDSQSEANQKKIKKRVLFAASDLASITNHIHNWVLFLLWLHPFILSGE